MERKLAAIFSTDVQGYSRLMGENEEATIRTLTAYREVITRLIQQHRGRVVDTPGDNLLAEFASAVDAVQAAVEIQHELQARNTALPPSRQMHYRIGLNVGDVVVEGERIYGDGVNIAARIESLAEGGGVSISGTVYDQVKNKLALSYASQGEQSVKNIVEPVRVWRVVMDEAAAALAAVQAAVRQAQHEQKPDEGGPGLKSTPSDSPDQQKRGMDIARLPRTVALAGIGLLLLAGIVVGVQYLSVHLPASSANIPPERTKTLPLPDKPSIAVLPLTNMSGDPEQEYFSDGMTEDIITDLSKLSGLFVIARNSTFTYKGKAADVKNVGRELGVRYVLEGSVQKASDRLRINVQLVDAMNGAHVWAERYDRPLQAVFTVQDDITQQIILALRVEMWEAELERVKRIPTDSLTAYDSFLRAKALLSRPTKETTTQARQMAERAIALDPHHTGGYIAMSWVYFLEWLWQWSPDSSPLERSAEMAQRAIALDDSLPEAHRALGCVHLFRRQHEQAIAEMERAIALDPNFADAHIWMTLILTYAGRSEEAIGWAEKAMRLNPRYPGWYLNFLAGAYFLTRRYEEALSVVKRALTLNPNLDTHIILAVTYSELDRKEEAQAASAEVLRMSPNFSVDAWGQILPFKDPATLERYLAVLRKAGLK